MPSSVAPRKALFSGFELDLVTRELFRDGKRIPLQDQPFQVLRMLLERPGELVTREVLRQELWPADTFVDFDHGLNRAVKKLREALAGASEELIETLPKRGYRFTGKVDLAEHTAAGRVDVIPKARSGATSRRNLMIGTALLVLALAGVAARQRVLGLFAPAHAATIHSVAVLPLQNLSGDPAQEYFSDGMSDALITDLAQAGSLKVISRTSTIQYKKTTKPLPQIARELGVDAVVEGSVTREGDHIRITAQLIDAPNDRHLWAKSYERQMSGVLALQDEIARDIAGEVQAALVPGRQRPAQVAIDPAAYNEYLLGRYFWNKRNPDDLRTAVDHFQAALARDPRYARAYAGLADAYLLAPEPGKLFNRGNHANARMAAQRALEFDDSLAEAHATLARLRWEDDWDFLGTEKEFRLAIELDPNYATAHQWHAQFLMERGRMAEAQAEARRALELDPLSLVMNNTYGEALAAARLYDQAIAQYQKTLAMDPSFFESHIDLAMLYRGMGKHDLAVHQLLILCENRRETCSWVGPIAKAFAAGGHQAIARLLIHDNLRAAARGEPVVAWDMATNYIDLGDIDQAFVWLNKSLQLREGDILDIKTSPLMDPLRKDPRFAALVKKVGLPD